MWKLIQDHTVHYSTVHYTTLQYTTVHYSTLHYTTVQYSTLHYSTVQYSTVQYSTLHYSTLHYSTVHYTTVQYTYIVCISSEWRDPPLVNHTHIILSPSLSVPGSRDQTYHRQGRTHGQASMWTNTFGAHHKLGLWCCSLTRLHLDPFLLCVPYIVVLYAGVGKDEANGFRDTATIEVVQLVGSHLVTWSSETHPTSGGARPAVEHELASE